ncbi:hypothetical protein ES332_D11G344200v1 [Gossypium tomentosum]|uniref:Uncharacterized protein n=1 Tax=Gossypium tomentosum TaxID=34277 RepID=A0A5D2IW19_GOSTO|nr:hypothetical protein ES332_D11G344200v1 [Gossypium tomentosum]
MGYETFEVPKVVLDGGERWNDKHRQSQWRGEKRRPLFFWCKATDARQALG